MNLGRGHYRIPQFGIKDPYNWSEVWAQSQFYKTKNSITVAASKCDALDITSRKDYDYCLKGAVILSSANADYNDNGCYCQNTYVNLQGT